MPLNQNHQSNLLLGSLIKKLRQERNLTQNNLGKECGLTREKMAAIEAGRCSLTTNLLAKIIDRLGLDRYHKTELLFAAIDEHPFLTFSEDIRDCRETHAWMALDYPLWLVDEEFRQETILAVSRGFKRLFFLPEHEWKCKHVLKRTIVMLPDEKTPFLRFYAAPRHLCIMNALIKNVPEKETDGYDNVIVTLGDLSNRTILGKDAGKALARELSGIMSMITDPCPEAFEGFKLLHISC
jgi:transcriptional regulator with XRE-family HTH domain